MGRRNAACFSSPRKPLESSVVSGEPALKVTRVVELPAAFERLVAASEGEGFEFVRRLEREWHSGANRFERPGEVLLAASVSGELVAIGGLNVDPYLSDPNVGRVRHVFVAPSWRDAGVGSALVLAILAAGLPHFSRIRLRTANARSNIFYERLGFERLGDDPTATHAYPR